MSCREMSLKISMTLESYDKQHVGREEDFRCALHRGLLSGLRVLSLRMRQWRLYPLLHFRFFEKNAVILSFITTKNS